MMRTFITADPHFSKDGTNTLNRPFSDAREMSEHVLDQYNSRASRGDRLIIVGDFSFREPAYWRTRLKCRNTILVLGNHDNRAKSKAAFGEQNVREQYDGKLCGHPTFFSHYPTLYWPKSHYGSFHCFGHVHDQRTDTIQSLFPDIRATDVSPDAAKRLLGEYTCFHEQEIYDLLKQRPGHDPVEFYMDLRGEYKKDHK